MQDRLGAGASEHPDPINVVQFPIQPAILHGLVELARGAHIGSSKFEKIVLVGHSFGSGIVLADLGQYPQDADGVILQSRGTNISSLSVAIAVEDVAIANQNDPAKFGELANGYLVYGTAIAFQFLNYKYPFFDVDSKSTLLRPSSPGAPSFEPSLTTLHLSTPSLNRGQSSTCALMRDQRTRSAKTSSQRPRLLHRRLALPHPPTWFRGSLTSKYAARAASSRIIRLLRPFRSSYPTRLRALRVSWFRRQDTTSTVTSVRRRLSRIRLAS